MTVRIKAALASLLNWLNAAGSIALAYALANPSAASDLLNLLPPKLKTPFAMLAPALWFILVQYAKLRALRPKL